MISIEDKIIKHQEKFANNCLFHPTDAVEDSWGKHIIDTFAKDNAINTIRIYTMFEDIVYMDEEKKLQYDFRVNDLRLDYLVDNGFNIMLAYAAVPNCISEVEQYTSVSFNKTRYKGKMFNTSQPKDYKLWEEVCYEYTKHIVDRYGIETVSKWYLQCFNEPDLHLFFLNQLGENSGNMIRLKEYCKMYKAFTNALLRVSDKLNIGGPALAGNLEFLEGFLNYVKEDSLRLDYIALHNYGTHPDMILSGELPIKVSNIMDNHKKYMAVIEKCGFSKVKVVYDEWGAVSHGFYNVEKCPEMIMRETEKMAAFFIKMVYDMMNVSEVSPMMMICLSGQHEMKTDFSGFRNFFTLNFIKKPIYNANILVSKTEENLLEYTCDTENVYVIPTKGEQKYAVLIVYCNDTLDADLPEKRETVKFNNIIDKNVSVYKIDKCNTNPYELYKTMNTDVLTDEQISLLRNEGQLKCETFIAKENSIDIKITANSVVLLEIAL